MAVLTSSNVNADTAQRACFWARAIDLSSASDRFDGLGPGAAAGTGAGCGIDRVTTGIPEGDCAGGVTTLALGVL